MCGANVRLAAEGGAPRLINPPPPPPAMTSAADSRLPLPRRRVLLALAGTAAWLAARHAAAEPVPKRVLIVHSFGREIAPYAASIAVFRRELALRSPEPVVFIEAALDAGRTIGPAEQAAFAAYLRERFADPVPDLIVSVAGPAAQFLVRWRDAIFPGVPLMMTAVDTRVVPRAALRSGDAVVATRIDVRRIFDALLRLLPDTATIAVVLGTTPLERYWHQQLQQDTAFLAGRVDFVWLDGLSLPQIKQRVATLPPRSAVYFGLLVVDGAGVPHEGLQALSELRQAANAPIFSIFESELGLGVVGGPYISQSLSGSETARLAAQQLTIGPRVGVQEVTIGMDTVAYDARELRRWRIDAARLLPGSELRFRGFALGAVPGGDPGDHRGAAGADGADRCAPAAARAPAARRARGPLAGRAADHRLRRRRPAPRPRTARRRDAAAGRSVDRDGRRWVGSTTRPRARRPSRPSAASSPT